MDCGGRQGSSPRGTSQPPACSMRAAAGAVQRWMSPECCCFTQQLAHEAAGQRSTTSGSRSSKPQGHSSHPPCPGSRPSLTSLMPLPDLLPLGGTLPAPGSRDLQVPSMYDAHIPRQHFAGSEAHAVPGHHVCLVCLPLLCRSSGQRSRVGGSGALLDGAAGQQAQAPWQLAWPWWGALLDGAAGQRAYDIPGSRPGHDALRALHRPPVRQPHLAGRSARCAE